MSTYSKTRIPKRFWGKTIEHYTVPPGEETVQRVIEKYTESLEQQLARGTGITLSGPPGTGKTLLMCIIGMAAADAGYSVFYMPMARYMRDMLNLIAWGGKEEMEEQWLIAQQTTLKVRNKVQFLLLDDVGKEHRTHSRFAQDEFDFMVRLRFDKALPTIITTNVPVEEWSDNYSDAMQSFASEAFPPLHLGESNDHRTRRP